ncbi:MAG: hypothetical protein RSB10_04115 [Clostridia bacterium]
MSARGWRFVDSQQSVVGHYREKLIEKSKFCGVVMRKNLQKRNKTQQNKKYSLPLWTFGEKYSKIIVERKAWLFFVVKESNKRQSNKRLTKNKNKLSQTHKESRKNIITIKKRKQKNKHKNIIIKKKQKSSKTKTKYKTKKEICNESNNWYSSYYRRKMGRN